MQCNVGKTERVIRVIAGLAIIAAGFMYESWWGAIGLVPLLTGATGYCPPYHMLGISTNKK